MGPDGVLWERDLDTDGSLCYAHLTATAVASGGVLVQASPAHSAPTFYLFSSDGTLQWERTGAAPEPDGWVPASPSARVDDNGTVVWAQNGQVPCEDAGRMTLCNVVSVQTITSDGTLTADSHVYRPGEQNSVIDCLPAYGAVSCTAWVGDVAGAVSFAAPAVGGPIR